MNKKWDYYYNPNSNNYRSNFFEENEIFYARIPSMDVKYADSTIKDLTKLSKKNAISAIVLDVRGNAGGTDLTYMNILNRVLKDTITYDIQLGFVYSEINRINYEVNNDTINKEGNNYTFNLSESTATIKNSNFFYVNQPDWQFIIPSKNRIPFNGTIYILQDKYIYSASNTLSSLAHSNDKIVSIGETPDVIGGLTGLVNLLCLPHSKLLFRLEPQIDFYNTKEPIDIFKNNVERISGRMKTDSIF